MSAQGGIGIDLANARRPDLDVRVVKRDRNGRAFSCTVESPLLESLQGTPAEDWDLPDSTDVIIAQHMANFSNPKGDRKSRLLALDGAGLEIWERAAPQGFKDAYAELTREEIDIETIQITSDEVNIPWEAMKPDDGDPRSLGERHTIARWFAGRFALRGTGAPAGDARVAAPLANPPSRRLSKGPAEAKLVRDSLDGQDLKATNPAAIGDQLRAWNGTVLHFVCHGTGGAAQELLLDGTERLAPIHVRGMTFLRDAWSASAPMVFLNACKAGQAAPSLNGAGGITESWTTVGAGAVIAPLWSVEDGIAHEVACEFYNRIIAEPETPYAEIIRDIRLRAREREHDSYAAYCYFGSPWASAG